MNHYRRSAQVWHVFSRDLTVLPAHPHVHPQSEWAIPAVLPSQLQLVLIYRPRRDGRLSRPWCEVDQAEVRTATSRLQIRHSATQPLAHPRRMYQTGDRGTCVCVWRTCPRLHSKPRRLGVEPEIYTDRKSSALSSLTTTPSSYTRYRQSRAVYRIAGRHGLLDPLSLHFPPFFSVYRIAEGVSESWWYKRGCFPFQKADNIARSVCCFNGRQRTPLPRDLMLLSHRLVTRVCAINWFSPKIRSVRPNLDMPTDIINNLRQSIIISRLMSEWR